MLEKTVARRTFLRMMIGATGAVLVAACNPQTPTPAAAAATKAPAAPTAAPKPTEPTGPVKGGTVTIAWMQEEQSMDPHNMTGWVGQHIRQTMFDPLEDLNGETCQVIPALAEGWNYSSDRSQVTYKLRQGVKFHDGTDFDAEALKWNYERLRNPKSTLTSSGGGTYGQFWTAIDVLDKYTLRITTGPDAKAQPTVFTPPVSYGLYVVSPAGVQKVGEDAFGRNPVGTGPYKFVKWEKGSETIVERNENYWRQGMNYPDRIVMKYIGEDNVRALGLLSGDIDVAPFLAPKEVAGVAADPRLDVLKNIYGEWSLNFNCQKEPFNKQANREAVVYALDEEAINKVSNYDMGYLTNGVPITSNSKWYDSSIPILKPDPARVKAKLTEAGNPDGFTFKGMCDPGAATRTMLEMIQSQLLPHGIKMEISTYERARYTEILRTDRSAADAALVGIRFQSEWENFRGIYYATGGNAFSGWQNAEADALTDDSIKLRGTGQDDKRMEMAKKWYRLFVRDWPGVAFTYYPQLVAYNKRIQGLKLHCEGLTGFTGMWVVPDKK
jgi:peptide/nickel transport system substrate-binding protein